MVALPAGTATTARQEAYSEFEVLHISVDRCCMELICCVL
jgi:hypothetical protein